MIQRVVLLLLFACFALKISAQQPDTARSIEGVEIKASKISVFTAGLKIERIDSTTLALRQGISLATLLAEQSPVCLRSYGPGGIATLSVRGTNSSQSVVFWNGVNLNQPNMGMTDLSRISTFEFSDVALQSGGASALLGSGVIGGSLHLSNALKFSAPVHASVLLTGGTTGKLAGAVKVTSGTERLAYAGSLSADYSQNNFWYTAYSGERKRLDHAMAKSISSVHQAEFVVNPKQRITAGIWYQVTDRQIPPTMTMNRSDQQQWDRALRSSLQWSYSGKNQSLIIRSAFIDEKEHYTNPTALIDAYYHLNTTQVEAEYKLYTQKQITLGGGVSGRLIRADIDAYKGIEYQPEGSLWLAIAYHHSGTGIKSALNLRQDFSIGYNIPFCPSLNAEIPVSKHITATFGVSRNFRVPTMNDRFWLPGGNPNLKPESSWNLETGADYQLHRDESLQSKISLDFYSLSIDNLIQWVPDSTALWSPMNVQKAWSRGVELSTKTDWKRAGFNGFFKFGYNYSPSTYRKAGSGQNEIRNKQMIYVPLHKIIETFYVAKSAYYIMISVALTGKRFVQSDNKKSLPSYSVIDFYTGTTIQVLKLKCRVQAEVRNITNTTYQSVLYYPEPGRSFAFSILINK